MFWELILLQFNYDRDITTPKYHRKMRSHTLLVPLALDRMNTLTYMQVCREIRKGAVASAPFHLILQACLESGN